MVYDANIRNEAIRLRRLGYSIREIARDLNIALSTSSLWMRNVVINDQARKRLLERRESGWRNIAELRRQKSREVLLEVGKESQAVVKRVRIDVDVQKLLCSMLFWAEGSKTTTVLRFTNSDPSMVATFLVLLRYGFKLEESRFRVRVHVHEYHDDVGMKRFWSKITKIPPGQFYKSYRKPHTGLRKKFGYQGCATITYYDARLAKLLRALYENLAEAV